MCIRDSINDWCISRQLWWGHQIPAWYVLDESQDSIEQNTPYIVARNEEDALIEANKKFGLNINAGIFQNLDRYEARKKIIKELDNLGLLTKIEDYKHTVPFSDRGKVPIEPLLSTQWFLKMDDISKGCLNEIDSKKPSFIPPRWEKVYKDWLENICLLYTSPSPRDPT